MVYSKNKWVAWSLILLILAVVVSNAAIIYMLLSNQQEVSTRIRNSINEEVGSIIIHTPKDGKDGKSVTEEQLNEIVTNRLNAYFAVHPVQNGKDGASIVGPQGSSGYSPVKGLDYFDGYTPQKGIDYFDGQNGLDGRTLYMRCNTDKNQWEQRYDGDLSWTVQLDQDGKPVKCTIGVVRE